MPTVPISTIEFLIIEMKLDLGHLLSRQEYPVKSMQVPKNIVMIPVVIISRNKSTIHTVSISFALHDFIPIILFKMLYKCIKSHRNYSL
jgi:hypothetical protein